MGEVLARNTQLLETVAQLKQMQEYHIEMTAADQRLEVCTENRNNPVHECFRNEDGTYTPPAKAMDDAHKQQHAVHEKYQYGDVPAPEQTTLEDSQQRAQQQQEEAQKKLEESNTELITGQKIQLAFSCLACFGALVSCGKTIRLAFQTHQFCQNDRLKEFDQDLKEIKEEFFAIVNDLLGDDDVDPRDIRSDLVELKGRVVELAHELQIMLLKCEHLKDQLANLAWSGGFGMAQSGSQTYMLGQQCASMCEKFHAQPGSVSGEATNFAIALVSVAAATLLLHAIQTGVAVVGVREL